MTRRATLLGGLLFTIMGGLSVQAYRDGLFDENSQYYASPGTGTGAAKAAPRDACTRVREICNGVKQDPNAHTLGEQAPCMVFLYSEVVRPADLEFCKGVQGELRKAGVE
jgi:hypothetical protein